MIEKENCKLKKEIEELREKLKNKKEKENNNFEPVKRGGLELPDDILLINNSDINNINSKIIEENIILEPIKDEPSRDESNDEPKDEPKDESNDESKDEPKDESIEEHTNEESKDDESNENEIISECVYVKKIKGVKYYISDNEAMNIYEINPDDSKGKLLGFLEKKKGKDDDENVKLKVKWY